MALLRESQAHIAASQAMTEIEARTALRTCDGVGVVEHWIAGQFWQVEPDGWTVTLDLAGWQFRLRPVLGALQISATLPGSGWPVSWVVPRP
jgi:hypothetical protein